MSEPRSRRFVSGTDVSRCDEECLRTGFCTDFCKVGQDFLALRQPAGEHVLDDGLGDDMRYGRQPASEPASELLREAVETLDRLGHPAGKEVTSCPACLLATRIVAALAAARGDTPSSEGGRNREHLSSAKAAPSPDPEVAA